MRQPPSARTPLRRPRGDGFTLVEMLVAMGILVFGFSALIGLLGLGVSTRRTAELRNQAVHAVDQVIHRAREQWFTGPRPTDAGEAKPPSPVVLDSIEGYPRLKAIAIPHLDETNPDLVLVVVRITWMEEGAVVGEEFRRVIDWYERFPRRVARARRKP